MGNTLDDKQKGPSFGGIVIQTDKPYYFAGDIVTGHIYIDVVNPNYPGNTLMLKIKGYEQCCWVTHHTRTIGFGSMQVQQSYTIKHRGHSLIYSNKVQIHSFGEISIQFGQYTFPFQFQLRPDIPGSIIIDESEFFGKINYVITAKIPKTEKSVTTLKGKQILNVREIFREQVQSLKSEITQEVSECGCISKGQTTLKASAEKNFFIAGQQCFVKVVIDNSRCVRAVSKINVKLMNTMLLKESAQSSNKRVKFISKKSQTGIQKNQGGDNEFIFELPIIDKSNVPLGGTTNGKIVNNSYMIRVELQMDVLCNCCSGAPVIDLPITVVTEVPPLPIIEKPENWQPQVIETLPIQFDHTNEYQPINEQGYLNQNIAQQNQGMYYDQQQQNVPSQQQQLPEKYNYPPQSQFSQQNGYQQPINYPQQEQPQNQRDQKQSNNNKDDRNPFS